MTATTIASVTETLIAEADKSAKNATYMKASTAAALKGGGRVASDTAGYLANLATYETEEKTYRAIARVLIADGPTAATEIMIRLITTPIGQSMLGTYEFRGIQNAVTLAAKLLGEASEAAGQMLNDLNN